MPYIRQATKQGMIWCDSGGVFDGEFPESKTRRGRVIQNGNVCPTIQTTSEVYRVVEHEGYIYEIRKLTPCETYRLMGWGRQMDGEWNDEEFKRAESKNSNTQLYKQAGNGICIPVLEHLFREIIKAEEDNV